MTSPTLDRVLDAVLRIDADLGVKFVSEQGQRWLGCTDPAQPAPIPRTFLDILHKDDAEVFLAACHGTPDYFTCDVRAVRQGQESWINVRGYQLPGIQQYALCIIDISAWKADESALRHAAEHDALTGLPNRVFLRKTVDQYIQAGCPLFSLAMLDLDGFKTINDSFGHTVGDAVLVETAKRLRKAIRPNDLLARLGGDEFVLFMNGKTADDAKAAMQDILFAIARPYDTSPHSAYMGVSIGVAEYPRHGSDYSMLLKNADNAMYQSKGEGKNRISIFLRPPESVDFSIRAAIHTGIEEGEFFMEFQPQFDVHRRLIGAEALMRWKSRTFGRVAPDQFIRIAEESGLMPFLGRWALRYACHHLREFRKHMPSFVMSVNVSPLQFEEASFDDSVLEVVAETGIDPAFLILEITESTLMHSKEKTQLALERLCKQGIQFSIDDFGTGFSSLAYLTRLPVTSIKIDKSFVRAIEPPSYPGGANRKLIAAMVNLAHSIDLLIVAEGIEDEEQFGFIRGVGCNLFQGYLLGKPMPAPQLQALLQNRPKGVA
ncbi:putative bifunctional diguanylate cyclase/phosphodiesterase [Candidatus Symbiobacter mobilis]|uniref:Signal transduction protein n=1 Tax=Candidatus Symbiobacter mobilis CR TaxID=946483 RepID=U5N7U7_9BURK|nr:GGDEF domain-containing phosphodiesterase [Candidatus Symbiobacter mobilis]AGX86279.1 signal transduction protein [Candidatus Symbiobacter mobilis CR]